MKQIEIVVPCYNEGRCIAILFNAIERALENVKEYEWNILFVNDGSTDDTLRKIEELREANSNRVNYISFTRNFGKEAAIYAGLENSTGDFVVLMDADLQHPPELLQEMIKVIEEGYDCCGGRRKNREGEPVIRSALSSIFYRLFNRFTEIDLVPNGSDYRMMTREMVKSVISLCEKERFSKGIMSWVGYRTKWIDYENVERIEGRTKWSFIALMKYAINGYISFSKSPLRLAIFFGGAVAVFSFIYAIYAIIVALVYDIARTGYTTIVSLMIFLNGVIIFILGIIGEYIAKIYYENKNRPIYIERVNTKKESHLEP